MCLKLSTKNDAQCESCKLSFNWGKTRPAAQEAAQETAHQVACQELPTQVRTTARPMPLLAPVTSAMGVLAKDMAGCTGPFPVSRAYQAGGHPRSGRVGHGGPSQAEMPRVPGPVLWLVEKEAPAFSLPSRKGQMFQKVPNDHSWLHPCLLQHPEPNQDTALSWSHLWDTLWFAGWSGELPPKKTAWWRDIRALRFPGRGIKVIRGAACVHV